MTQEQRKAENEGVTEDDVNEIKNDISAFRFEMIEIMRASGMNTQSASGPSGFNFDRVSTYQYLNIYLLNLIRSRRKEKSPERAKTNERLQIEQQY